MLFGCAVTILGASIVLMTACGALSAAAAGGSGEQLVSPVPGAAGNLPRLTGLAGRRANQSLIGPFQQRFQGFIGGPHTGYMHGLYGMPGLADPATDGVAWVMYAGYNEPRPVGDDRARASRLMRALAGMARSWITDAGPAGGTARCAHTRYGGTQVTVCGWATARTVGAVMSPARVISLGGLASLMRQMRPDLAGLARPASFP